MTTLVEVSQFLKLEAAPGAESAAVGPPWLAVTETSTRDRGGGVVPISSMVNTGLLGRRWRPGVAGPAGLLEKKVPVTLFRYCSRVGV